MTRVLALPIRFTSGVAATVDADTIDEIGQCVTTILRTHPGDLPATPLLGIPDDTFRQGGVRVQLIRDAIERHEPRARFIADAQLEQLASNVRVELTGGVDG